MKLYKQKYENCNTLKMKTLTNKNMKLATQRNTETATTDMWKFSKGNMKTWRTGGVECWEGDVQVKSVLAEKEKITTYTIIIYLVLGLVTTHMIALAYHGLPMYYYMPPNIVIGRIHHAHLLCQQMILCLIQWYKDAKIQSHKVTSDTTCCQEK